MKIKRFFAKDMRTALKEVKEELGVDAVIMSNKKLANGVEIVAAVDYDKAATKPPEQPQSQPLQELHLHILSKVHIILLNQNRNALNLSHKQRLQIAYKPY